jgi:hypothetical protein
MLQQVLSQLAIYSTNTVNINLIERGDNGANVSTAELVKITKLVSRFFERMENHILEGIHPDTVPAFTPKDSNPNHKVPSVIVTGTNAKERPTAKKTKLDDPPQALLLVTDIPRSQNSKWVLVQKTSQRLVYYDARKVPQSEICSPGISPRSIAPSSVSTTKNSPSQSNLVISNMLANGIRFSSKTRPKFSSIAIPAVERSGSTRTLSLSIGS